MARGMLVSEEDASSDLSTLANVANRNEYVGFISKNFVGIQADVQATIQAACSSATKTEHKRQLTPEEHVFSSQTVSSQTFFSFSCPSSAVLSNLPEGIVAEPNGVMTIQAAPKSWGLDRIDQENLPLNRRPFTESHTGKGVTVYVIDTGIYADHNEFGGRASYGADFVNEGFLEDGNGHGTHTSGTATGINYGIANEAFVIGVKVLNSKGSGSYENVIQGINWAVANASVASVLTLSLGGGQSETMNQAVRNAAAAGHIVTVAAGNSQSDGCLVSPGGAGGFAEDGGIITVMASDMKDNLAFYSCFGKCTDIIAPGTNIKSAWKGSRSATKTISGTSMATPHVAGVAAVLLQKHNFDKQAAQAELMALRVAGKIKGSLSGGPNALLQVPTYTGQPTLPTQKPTFPPSPEPFKACAGSTCTFDFGLSTFGRDWVNRGRFSGPGAVADTLLCDPVPANTFKGKIVLVSRGDCNYYTKVKTAETAGAIAVVLYTYSYLSVTRPNTLEFDTTKIPSMLIGWNDALAMKAEWATEIVGYGDFNTATPTAFPTARVVTSRPTKSPTGYPTSRPSTERPSKSPTKYPTSRPSTARPSSYTPQNAQDEIEFDYCRKFNWRACSKQTERCTLNRYRVGRRWVLHNTAFKSTQCLPTFLTDAR